MRGTNGPVLAGAKSFVDSRAALNAHEAFTSPGHLPAERPVLLFDGVCHLCHGSVKFVLRHERAPLLLFAALQSDTGRALLRDADLPSGFLDSLVLFDEGRMFTRSEAALRVCRHLRAPWSWARLFRILPRVLRDPVYDWIARHRYRWFGRDERVCLVPSVELRERFLR